MGIYEQVNDQIKESMRAREAARTAALRNIRAGFIDLMKQDNSQTLTDEQCVSVIRRLASSRERARVAPICPAFDAL